MNNDKSTGKNGNLMDLTGQRFSMLVVVSQAKNINGRVAWNCVCDCGSEKIAIAKTLRNGLCKSCGCLTKTHGQCETRLYNIWGGMIGRCYRENSKDFKRYGGRGVKVYDEWRKSFESFYAWSHENGYDDTLSIDRIDVNGSYEPSNCRWATALEQQRNKNNNAYVEYNGEVKCLKEWSEVLNINYSTLKGRYRRKLPVERLFEVKDLRKEKLVKNNDIEQDVDKQITGVEQNENK